jgi:hypothetical protein
MKNKHPNFRHTAGLALGALAFGALPFGGCLAPIVGQSNGYFIDQEVVSDDSVHADIQLPAELVYEAARDELKTLSTSAVEVNPATLFLTVAFEEGSVTAEITPSGENRTGMLVTARGPALPRLDTAKKVVRGVQVRLSKIKR